jgi:hypothetical protein
MQKGRADRAEGVIRRRDCIKISIDHTRFFRRGLPAPALTSPTKRRRRPREPRRSRQTSVQHIRNTKLQAIGITKK